MAEIWRDVFLFDPDLRGQFRYVIFAFEDTAQSTTRLILDEITKDKKGSSKGRSRDGALDPVCRRLGATPRRT